ncbi:OprD family outer membrane porin, partial [Pseudomonas aeruginosa]
GTRCPAGGPGPGRSCRHGRLLPVTFEGGQVTSTDLKDFTLVAGQLEHSKGRNSTDNRSLIIAGANGSSAGSRDSNKFYYAGGD